MITFKLSDERLSKAIKNASKKLGDLTPVYKVMASEWYKGNRSLFIRSGKGRFVDLSPKYKKRKTKALGSPYPILEGFTSKLKDSLINPGNENAVNTIVNKKTLILGTKVTSKKGDPYPIFLQEGTRFMPAREHVLVGNEQTAPGPINKRLNIWIERLNEYSVEAF